MLYDLDKFKRQLREQNLLTAELEEFIDNYMRFDNTKDGIACEEAHQDVYARNYDEWINGISN